MLCPGFAIDCLETLEEIAEQNAEAYVHAGGGELRYIPALNHGAAHVATLSELIQRQLGGWLPASADQLDSASRLRRVAQIKSTQPWLGGP